MASSKKPISLEEGWSLVSEQGISVVENYLQTGHVRYPPIKNPDGSTKLQLFTNQEHSNLYSIVFIMATQKDNHAAALYSKYSTSIGDYLENKVKPKVERSCFRSDTEFLEAVVAKWTDHKLYIECLHRIFLYLDRYYVTLASLDTLEKTGLKLWVKHIYLPLSDTIFRALLDLIEQDRQASCEKPIDDATVNANGETIYAYTPAIDADLVKSLTNMIDALCEFTPVYQDSLRPKILEHASNFYTQMASVWVSTLSFAEYLKRTEKALADEEARCSSFFFAQENAALQKTLQDCLLVQPQDRLLQMPTGVEYMLLTDAKEDLHRAFCLFGKYEKGLQPMAHIFKQHVQMEGQKLIKAKSDAILAKGKPAQKGSFASLTGNPDVTDLQFMSSLIHLHQKFSQYVSQVFSLSSSSGTKEFNFSRALKNAFESFINADIGGYPMAAFLCTYADKLIRRPPNAGVPLPTTQEAMEEEIRKLVELFTYLSDKDLFAEGYRQQLARRLIGASGLPHEAEKYLVAKLKEECGNSFSCKLEGMLADSAETHVPREEFAAWLKERPLSELQLEFNVQVLTTGHWPAYPQIDMKLPPVINEGIEKFKEWYDTRTRNRKLTWINTLSQAIVAANLKRPHELVCTGFQAALLLLFNEPTAENRLISLRELGEGSGLHDAHLKKQVKCLYGKHPVVLKVDNPDDPENPMFKANLEFTCAARRFKMPVPLQEEGQQKDNIQQDRSIAIEAAIVRVMKARKQMNHAQLVSEVVQRLNLFKPQPQDIKRCIENLLSREFLSRGEEEGQSNVYTYLA